MKLVGIIEDRSGRVLGVSVESGPDVLLADKDRIPRSDLQTQGRALAEQCGIEIPPELDALLPRQIGFSR